jgi:hypothetical protein
VKIDDTLRELETVADKKGIRVAYEPLTGEVGAGGLCKVKGEYRIIVDKRATAGERVTVLAQALSSFSLDDVFVAPEVRELIARSAAFRRS